MSLKYEPASVPQHISVKWLFLGCIDLSLDDMGFDHLDALLVAFMLRPFRHLHLCHLNLRHLEEGSYLRLIDETAPPLGLP